MPQSITHKKIMKPRNIFRILVFSLQKNVLPFTLRCFSYIGASTGTMPLLSVCRPTVRLILGAHPVAPSGESRGLSLAQSQTCPLGAVPHSLGAILLRKCNFN
jgi:hypothetical protein